MFDELEIQSPDTPDLFEGMTAISAVLDPSIGDFNDRRVLSVFVDKTRMDKKAREIAFLNRRAEELGFLGFLQDRTAATAAYTPQFSCGGEGEGVTVL